MGFYFVGSPFFLGVQGVFLIAGKLGKICSFLFSFFFFLLSPFYLELHDISFLPPHLLVPFLSLNDTINSNKSSLALEKQFEFRAGVLRESSYLFDE